jgi:DNA (cytosine-5)-methyltransferase 1
MNVIDIFSGVGGLSQGFVMENFNIVFAIEVDKSISDSYKLNHKITDMYNEDITKIDINNLYCKYKKEKD